MVNGPYLDAPHPDLKEPILYVADVPNHVKWSTLLATLSCCGPVRSGGKSTVPGTKRMRWKVVFHDLFNAEMALATLPGVQVQGVDPPWHLSLSHSPLLVERMRVDPILPLFISTTDLDHPLRTSDAQSVFVWFRRGGPLVSVQVNVDIGNGSPSCVLEYWSQEHAQYARKTGPAIHPTTMNMKPFILRMFDPWKLFCAQLPSEVQVEELHKEFGKFGNIIDAHIIRRNKIGFITFQTREEAAKARNEMNGKTLGGGNLLLRYHEPRKEILRPHRGARVALGSSAAFRGYKSASDVGGCSQTHSAEETQKEAAEEKARQERIKKEAAEKTRQERIRDARIRCVAAENAEREANTLRDKSMEQEAENTKTFILAELEEKEAEQELEQAQSAFEQVKQLFDEAQARLMGAQNGVKCATFLRAHASAVLRDATKKREAAEEKANKAREERENVEREAREVLGEDILSGDQPDEKARQREELRKREEMDKQAREAKVRQAKMEEVERQAREELRKQEEIERQARETKMREAELEESRRKLEELRRQEEADRLAEEARKREAELEESRRKIAEFEAEERQRKLEKEAEERLREAANRAKEERERKFREEAERKARELREKEERAQAEERARRRAYEQGVADEKTRCRRRDEARWTRHLPWDPTKSLARFKLVSTEFDEIKFCIAQPLTFEGVPWPTLHSPYCLTLDHIEWQAVEEFFREVEGMVDAVEYRALVEKTHRRFHPDKWKSRGLLNTIIEEEARESVEKAGNIVAQALTPIWLKSRKK